MMYFSVLILLTEICCFYIDHDALGFVFNLLKIALYAGLENCWIVALGGPWPKCFVGPHYTYSMKHKDPLIHLKSIVSESFYFL